MSIRRDARSCLLKVSCQHFIRYPKPHLLRVRSARQKTGLPTVHDGVEDRFLDAHDYDDSNRPSEKLR